MLDPADILLTDQVAIVTGGASGIGAGIALNFARFGADVVIADKDSEKGEGMAAQIRAIGRRALSIATDVFHDDQIRAMIERAHKEFGRLDILVNNAGGVRGSPFLALSERSRRRHIDFNLMSVMTATECAGRIMRAGGGGSIINVASIEAFRAAPNFAVYGAAKAAMVHFTRSMAVELAEYGIRVNVIAPDIIVTGGLADADRSFLSAEKVAARARYIPLSRDGVPDDCGGVAVFLASRLAHYVTGTTLHVDGGTFASSGWSRDGAGGWELFELQNARPD